MTGTKVVDGGGRVFVVTGLQRSGNHAVIGWMTTLFQGCVFHNDNAHDLFARPDLLDPLLPPRNQAGPVIFSFEDSTRKAVDPGLPLLDSVAAFPQDRFPDLQVRQLVILRDPYNLWASRVAGHSRKGGAGLTSDPSWDLFRRNWIALARRCQVDPEGAVLFNRWAADPAYRRALAARLGGRYSETALGRIRSEGGGSSFDRPRPTYGRMLRDWRRYLNTRRLKRVWERPSHYLKRMLAPPLTADQLQLDERWRTLREDPAARMLFEDAELRQISAAIFGPDLVSRLDRPASAA